MIIENKKLHIVRLLVPFCLLIAVLLFSFSVEKSTCMGVKVVSAEEYLQMAIDRTDNLDVDFMFNNLPAAVDNEENIIYISQKFSEDIDMHSIQGELTSVNPNFQLAIKEDTARPLEIMTTGGNYTLLATAPNGKSTEYKIIFTSLPLINFSGEIIGVANNNNELYSGEITFFDPDSPETGSYRNLSSEAQWNIRGNTTAKQPKKPWKLSLKKSNSENKNLSLCGLGSDDDWILNPMNLDDLKIREKLMMDLWNQDELFNDEGHKMSSCEYVEVVMNGEYQGLYLMQRRLDKKYLNIPDQDILLKSRNMSPQSAVTSKTMEIVYSPFSETETMAWLEKYFDGKYISRTNIENWAEMTAFLQVLCSVDNRQTKNIVMHLDIDENNEYVVNYILWDTDMSLGLCWDAGYVYDYDEMVFKNIVRFEYSQLSALYPSLSKDISARWQQLRKDLLSDENINENIQNLYNTITYSNSFQRDADKWGLNYNGIDNMDQLNTFMKNRLGYLDNYYSVD